MADPATVAAGADSFGHSPRAPHSPLLLPPITFERAIHHSASLFRLTCTVFATMSMEESISLEETNKIRISLGLKPLTDDKAPAGDKDAEAEDNYAKKRELEAKDRQSKWVSELHLFQTPLNLSVFPFRAVQDRIAK